MPAKSMLPERLIMAGTEETPIGYVLRTKSNAPGPIAHPETNNSLSRIHRWRAASALRRSHYPTGS